ncbi:peptidoglycan D,D-transpeptidase FtsI family protein [Desulfotruncus arcticus]|nr:penicillin-binding transpeptidase domain-containing protein [Desulfotruncus arcticus]
MLSFWAMTMAFALITWHLYNIQLVEGNSYALRASQIRSQEVALEEFMRGEITDRNQVPLSGGYYANRVVVFPKLMQDQQKELEQLAQVIGQNSADLNKKARDGAFYLTLNLTSKQLQALQTTPPEGVFLLPVYIRYGDKPLAGHITGYLGKISSQEQFVLLQQNSAKNYNLGDWVGQSGLEYFYEQELKGTYPQRWARVALDARGRVINGEGLTVNTSAADPARLNVVTTIDRNIQQIVESVMDAHMQNGAVIVMKAGSGDILAMASRPGYDPSPARLGHSLAGRQGDVYVDHCTSLFQPGSVFKVVLAAAAIDLGMVDLDEHFTCLGANAGPVRCWLDGGHGRITFQQAFAESCNPVFVEIGERLGADTIIDYAGALGLSNQAIAGYPIKGDKRQNLAAIGERFNLANSSVGQGPVLVTPVQVTAMLNTIASGGLYYPPRLVAGVADDQGRFVREIKQPEPTSAISAYTAGVMQDLLREVTEVGVGTRAQVAQWGSAGKTGSAQLNNADGTVDAWFSGFTPVNNPQYVITVMVHDGSSGGATAAPVFKEIAEKIMQI